MAAKSKISLLDLGRMDVDDGFFIRGATAAVQSNPHPAYERRRVAVVAAVIEHPQAGPILFETGCAQNAHASHKCARRVGAVIGRHGRGVDPSPTRHG